MCTYACSENRENTDFPTPFKQRNTVIKYTKLPEFDIECKGSWHRQSHSLQPRLRRITTIEDSRSNTSRSSKISIPLIQPKTMATSICNRKIFTISEDDEIEHHPKFSADSKKIGTVTSNRSIGTDLKREVKQQILQRTSPHLTTSAKYLKETRPVAKKNNVCGRKEPATRPTSKNKPLNNDQSHIDNTKRKAAAEKDSKDNLCDRNESTTRYTYRNRDLNSDQSSTESIRSRAVVEKESRETRLGVKINRNEIMSRFTSKNKHLNSDQSSMDSIRSRPATEKDKTRKIRSTSLYRTRLSKNLIIPSDSEHDMPNVKVKFIDNFKTNTSKKQNGNPSLKKSKSSFLIEMQHKRKSSPVIHVPLEEKYHKPNVIHTEIPSSSPMSKSISITKPEDTVEPEIILRNDMNVGTEPLLTTKDQVTHMESYQPEIIYKCIKSTDVQTDLVEKSFDKLEIPNVSLKKDKSEREEKLLYLHSTSLPNLQIPSLNITSEKNKSLLDTHYCKSTSYIIRRATLTYRTRQKINLHVVSTKDNAFSNQSTSQLTPYPMNVVSVFRKEISSRDTSNNISLEESHKSKSSKVYKNCINEIKSLGCSYVPNSNTLMKPSDIISTISVNNELIKSALTEQFQKELSFIDSFFETLQYLESCSLSEKRYKKSEIDDLVNPALLDSQLIAKNSEYDSFLSNLENSANSDDSETMASKSLFLLNILIRKEQRRAKNFLCVLKRREDALKDFTKSQILYLESKKKQDNTDISVLKKKQRGALLKLQHECGEMQRMRKALLALSEKRKVTLMKTKKDLELKLKNNVNFEQIILGKKKPKRNTAVDRNFVPLKCFDLSSSGCEDSTTSRLTSDSGTSASDTTAVAERVASAEKSIQTGDSIFETTRVNQSTDTAAENFVVVDGGYLNILFHNLSLPQIFSSVKQYEVNEKALKNIVDSTNELHSEKWNDVVEKLIDEVKSNDEDKSSTPSTARSLVEEFEQYYKTLSEEDRSRENDGENKTSCKVFQTSEVTEQTASCQVLPCASKKSTETMTNDDPAAESIKVSTVDESCECELLKANDVKEPALSPTGPLPVPAGAADVTDEPAIDTILWPTPTSSNTSFPVSSISSQPSCELTSVSSLVEPAHSEAEELRRQQLAIEREIKELEQQQCRLLVVREIPDKPPPPYTPPSETRVKQPRVFDPAEVTVDRIRELVVDPAATYDRTDAFDVLTQDFCRETLERKKLEQSDRPWDACNLLPQKPPLDPEKLVENSCIELKEVLTATTPVTVSSVSSRRTDHIDDILFTEWQRAEPEWTSLHNDETLVKNQLFETIFQRILTETVDEYKRTVLAPVQD